MSSWRPKVVMSGPSAASGSWTDAPSTCVVRAFDVSVGTLFDLAAEGKVDMVGVSNVDTDQIERARALGPVVSVQNQFGPSFTTSAPEIDACTKAGVAFLAWGTL